jgi:hypothetical protein
MRCGRAVFRGVLGADEAVFGVEWIARGVLLAGEFAIFRGKRSERASAKNDTPE